MRGAALLLLAPLLPASLADAHAFHAAGQPESTIYADARHAGQADHLEAAERVRIRRCGECLAPAKVRGLAPARAAVTQPLTACGRLAAADTTPRWPATPRPGRPRAPPLS